MLGIECNEKHTGDPDQIWGAGKEEVRFKGVQSHFRQWRRYSG